MHICCQLSLFLFKHFLKFPSLEALAAKTLLLLEAAPTSQEPAAPPDFSPETLGHWGACQPMMTPISYLQRNKNFSKGCQEVKTFLQTEGHRRVWIQRLQKPRVQLTLLG